MTALREVTDATFAAQVLGSERPVLVEYWAPWCGPCRQLEPILEELADGYGDRVDFVKIDTADNPIAPADHRVMHLPTVQLFRGGQVVHTFHGSKPRNTFREILDQAVTA